VFAVPEMMELKPARLHSPTAHLNKVDLVTPDEIEDQRG
jgi:hypothetical protein